MFKVTRWQVLEPSVKPWSLLASPLVPHHLSPPATSEVHKQLAQMTRHPYACHKVHIKQGTCSAPLRSSATRSDFFRKFLGTCFYICWFVCFFKSDQELFWGQGCASPVRQFSQGRSCISPIRQGVPQNRDYFSPSFWEFLG